MAVSIKQIAEASNVSISTASRVLRGRGEIAPATRDRVMEAAKRLKYRPNLLYRGMRAGRTQTVGVMMRISDAFQRDVLAGIQEELAEVDYAPLVVRPGPVPHLGETGEKPTELQEIHRLIDHRVDGVILCPLTDSAQDDYFQEIWDHQLPAVAVDRRLANTHMDFVGSDDRGGAEQAAKYLLELGHRRIGQISGPSFTSTGQERAKAFEQAVMQCPGATCRTIENRSFRYGFKQAIDLLSVESSRRPTAVFAGNDTLAMGVYRAAGELGLRIGPDVSVVGFADLPFAASLYPALTTVRQEGERIGRYAARLIMNRITGSAKDRPPKVIRVATSLIERESATPCEQAK